MRSSLKLWVQSSLPRSRYRIRSYPTKNSSSEEKTAKDGTRRQQDTNTSTEKAASSFSARADSFSIDYDNKKVTTASATLPLSPIMDPAFHDIRGQYTRRPKEDPRPRAPPGPKEADAGLGLDSNIYAKALATPIRACAVTKVHLPSFFLTNFKSVRNPEAENNWLVPTEVSLTDDGRQVREEIPGPGVHLLCQQQLYREFFVKGSKYSGSLDRLASKLSRPRRKILGPKFPVWREDMDSYLLRLLRRQATQCLIRLAGMVETADRNYILKAGSWEDAKQRIHIGCVLYLGPLPQATDEDITESTAPGLVPPPARLCNLRLEEKGPGTRVPVHDLRLLLGERNVARLRRRKALFRDGELFVVKGVRTGNLQMQLWRLQGYMATQETESPNEPPPETGGESPST